MEDEELNADEKASIPSDSNKEEEKKSEATSAFEGTHSSYQPQ
jgi:hypothetical protein